MRGGGHILIKTNCCSVIAIRSANLVARIIQLIQGQAYLKGITLFFIITLWRPHNQQCSDQVKLTTVLWANQKRRSDWLDVSPPLY